MALPMTFAGLGCHDFEQPRPAPMAAITTFAARDPVITRGGGTLLEATFTGAGSVSGVGPILSGMAFPVAPGVTTIYTLTVAGAGGTILSRQAEVQVVDAVPPPQILVDPIREPGPGTRTARALDLDGLSYRWSLSGPGTILGGESTDTLSYRIDGSGTLTLECIAINAAGQASATATSSVPVPAPAPPSATITAPAQATAGAIGLAASVPDQVGATYAWQVQGGTVTGGAGTSRVAFTAGAAGVITVSVTVTGPDGTAATGSTPIQVLPPPGAPALTAPPFVTARQAGCTASVALPEGFTCAWTLDDAGLITRGANAAAVTFTAGDPGTLTLNCVLTDADGVASPPGQASVQVVPAPAQPFLTAPGRVQVGQAVAVTTPGQALASYAWTVANATFTGDGPAITLTPTGPGPVQVTCIVTSAAGAVSPPGQATLTAVAGGTILAVAPRVTAGLPGPATLQPAPPGPVRWTLGNASLDAGDGRGSITFTPGAPGPVTLGWTLEDGSTGQQVILAEAAPAVTSFKASAAQITLGGSATLAWSASGPGLLMPGQMAVQASGTLAVSPQVTTPYTLQVLNAAGAAQQAAVTVTVLPAPVIRSFSAARPFIGKGAAATLRADFDPGPGGTARVDPGGLAITAGADLVTGPVTATTDFVLTVRNAAGTARTRTVRVRPGTLVLKAGTPSGEGTVDGPAASAKFELPVAVAVDPASGITYVADREAHTVRALGPDGTITTLAGDPVAPGVEDGTGAHAHFLQPTAVAWDPKRGLLWVADAEARTLRRVTPAGAVTTWAGTPYALGDQDGPRDGATFRDPEALAVGPDGTVYLADAGNHRIRALTPDDQVVTLAGFGTPGNVDNTNPLLAKFWSPSGLAVAPDGTVYVADQVAHAIRRIAPHGGVVTVAGVPFDPGDADQAPITFNQPAGLALDPARNWLYVADAGNHALRVLDLGTGLAWTPAGLGEIPGYKDGTGSAARFNQPMGVAQDKAGDLVIADARNRSLRTVTLAGVATTLAGAGPGAAGWLDGPASQALFDQPGGLDLAPDGSLWVGESGNPVVRRIQADGTVTTVAGNPATAGSQDGPALTLATFRDPAGLVLGGTTLWVADQLGGTIRKVDLGAQPPVVTTLGPPPRFSLPSGPALDAQGNLYVADPGAQVIYRVTPGGSTAPLAGSPGQPGFADGTQARFHGPGWLAIRGTTLFVADLDNRAIRTVDTATGQVATLAGDPDARDSQDGQGASAHFPAPAALDAGPDGTVYVADPLDHTIRMITPDGVATTLVGVSGHLGLQLGPLPGGLCGPNAVKVDPATGDLYITVPDAVLQVHFD